MKNYVNKSTGEVIDDIIVEFFQDLKRNQEYLDSIDVEISEHQKKIDALKQKAKEFDEDKMESLRIEARALLESSNEKTISSEYGEIKIRKSTSLEYTGDVETLPEGAYILKKQADKKAIKELLENGVVIDGATIQHKENISFSIIK